MLDRLQKLGVRVSKQQTEARRPGWHGEVDGNRGCEAADQVEQLRVLELHGVRLPQDDSILPAKSHHQQRPCSE